jgi:murein DD-endopeptidase MepM/ murein hydrolase activator NlpD
MTVSASKNYEQNYGITLCRQTLFYTMMIMMVIFNGRLHAQNYNLNNRAGIYTQEIVGDTLVLKASNDFAAPVTLKLELRLENLTGDSSSVLTAVVPAKTYAYELARYKRTVSDSAYKCTYTWKLVLGDTTKTAALNYLYGYPFPYGLMYPVSQGPGEAFSHENSYAYDFAMPAGSPVAAARDGIVVALKSNSSIGGPDKIFTDSTNYISILHTDGTIGNYLHLQQGGVIVEEGQAVKRGQIIAYSGNTGYSTRPHLHFEVIQPDITAARKQWVQFKWAEPGNVFFPETYNVMLFNIKP